MFPGSKNSGPSQTSSTHWTKDEDKLFEQALAIVPEELPNRWEIIAEHVPGKSLEDIKKHYDALVHDLLLIESGFVELPNYADDVAAEAKGMCDSASVNQPSSRSRPTSSKAVTMRKGTLWTEEEHKKFLTGLEKCGRGDWRSISRNYVVTKTPTQVADHAQKFFERQNPDKKTGRKRASINDITTVDTNVVPPAVGQRDDFFRRSPANNERTVVAPANDQGSSSEVSTARTTGDETVESSPYSPPDQMGGNGHGN